MHNWPGSGDMEVEGREFSSSSSISSTRAHHTRLRPLTPIDTCDTSQTLRGPDLVLTGLHTYKTSGKVHLCISESCGAAGWLNPGSELQFTTWWLDSPSKAFTSIILTLSSKSEKWQWNSTIGCCEYPMTSSCKNVTRREGVFTMIVPKGKIS